MSDKEIMEGFLKRAEDLGEEVRSIIDEAYEKQVGIPSVFNYVAQKIDEGIFRLQHRIDRK